MEIEGVPKNCDATRWGQFTDIKDIKKEMFKRLESHLFPKPQGRAAETLVQEAVERFLNYDEWFSREVDKGLATANRGEFVEHDDIRKMIDSRYIWFRDVGEVRKPTDDPKWPTSDSRERRDEGTKRTPS